MTRDEIGPGVTKFSSRASADACCGRRSVRRLAWVFAVAGLLVGPGCGVLTDEQSFQFRYDEAADRLDFLVLSRGLWASMPAWSETDGQKGSIQSIADEWLDAIARGDRWCTLPVLPWDVNLDDPARRSGDDDVFTQVLRDLMRVKHGDFFLDARGRLCMWQCWRIEHVSRLLAAVNREIGAALRDPERIEQWRKASNGAFPDERTAALLATAAAHDFTFVAMRGHALVLRAPLSRDAHCYLVGRAVDELVERSTAPGGAAQAARWLRECLAKEWSLLRSGDITEILLGNPDSTDQTFEFPSRDSGVNNLLPHLERRHVPVRPSATETDWRAAFDAFCASEH